MSYRTMLGVVAVLCILGVGAWFLESARNRPPGTTVVTEDGKEYFVVELPEQKGSDIVIQCDESEFQEAFRQFRDHLGIKAEPLALPGGALAIGATAEHGETPEALAPAARSAVEILKRHSPTRVVLLTHDDCLYYDTIAAWRDQLDHVRFAQGRHLRLAKETILKWLPKAKVEAYFARREGKRLIFESIHNDSASAEAKGER